jgi:hypothetical protein
MALVRTDVVGSTPLTLRLGDDDAGPVMQRHLRSLRVVVDAYHGRLVKSLGDGLLAAFDSATTAVRASREMQACIHRDNRRSGGGFALHIRVGVSAGDIVWSGGDVEGRPAIESERLQSVAEPDQILCSRLVVDLTGGRFDDDVRSLGRRALKGYPQEIEVYEVAWHPTDSHVSDVSPALRQQPRTAFVARDAVLAALHDRWRRAEAGDAGMVLLAGEAGIGKSRLARELALRVHSEGGTVLYGRCAPDRAQPYEPFAEALDHFVAQERGQRYRLGGRAGDLAPLMPGLVRPQPAAASDSDAAVSGVVAERATVRQAVWSWFVELADDDPVLLVVEDLQWSDAPTLGLMRHTVRSLHEERLLVVATLRTPLGPDRENDLARACRSWRRSHVVEEIVLDGLSADGARAMVEAMAGQALDSRAEHAFTERIREHTGGNPLFIEAVVAHLIAHGALYEQAGRWIASSSLRDMDVPPAVQDVVVGQLAPLAEEDRSVLQLAALLGSVIELDMLVAAAADLGCEAAPVVERATRSGLLVEADGTPGCYRFSHEIVRTAVAGSVSGTRRVDLHRLIGRTMEARYAPLSERQADELSYQLSFSSVPTERARAADYAVRAAEQAWARRAMDTAATFYLRAAELYAATDDLSSQCDALIDGGRAAKRAGDPAARAKLAAAIGLADRLGDGERMARAALACSRGMFSTLGAVDMELVDALERALFLLGDGDSPLRASALATLGAELTYSQDHDRREEVSSQGVAMARRVGDPVGLASVLNLYATTLWRPDRLAERLELAAELERITAGLGQPQWRFSAASFGFQAAMEAGLFPLADERLAHMESAARQLDQPGVSSYLRLRQAMRLAVAGDLAEAERLANEAVERGRAAGYRDADVFYAGQMWMVCYHTGRLDEMRVPFELAAEASPEHTVLRAALAALYGETGEISLCRTLVDGLGSDDFTKLDQDLLVTGAVATMAARAVGDVRLAGILQGVLGDYEEQLVDNGSAHFGAVSHWLAVLAGVMGDDARAAAQFAQAAAAHTRLREWPMLARTWLERGHWLAATSGPAAAGEARTLFDRARTLASRHGCAGTVAAVDGEVARLDR